VSVQFRILGPVEIEVDGEVYAPLSRRERCLLGVLLLEANRVVSVERLAEFLWDGEPPKRLRGAVQGNVSRLRAALTRATDGAVDLVFASDGYRLVVNPDAVDAYQFSTLLERASRTADLPTRVDQLRVALDLWRGPALADAISGRVRERLCSGLEEQRLAAFEDFASVSLALRQERELLPELARVAGDNPGRENLVALHMRALYQAGRRMDALDTYARTRAYLADHLGLDPTPRLRDLHQAILRDDLTAFVSTAPRTTDSLERTASVRTIIPRQLPADVAGFTGRHGYLEQLDSLLPEKGGGATSVVISAIGGTAGVGKTALAVHWARHVSARFPDGQLYINLRGFDPGGSPMEPAEAIRVFLDALEVSPHRIPTSFEAQIGLYRSLLSDRQMLVVIDNARNAEQVRSLLPSGKGCFAVVTSRNRLSSLASREGARVLTLDTLTRSEALQLLEGRLGVERVTTEPAAADEIISRCAGLPLALAIVAANAASQVELPLQTLMDRSRANDSDLDSFTDIDSAADVRSVFSWSYRALAPDTARVFRLLGLHPGPDVTIPAVASLADLPDIQAHRLIRELTDANLIAEQTPGRYAFHDLLRAYALELVQTHDSDAEQRAAMQRMLDFYLHTARAGAALLDPHKANTLEPTLAGIEPESLDSRNRAMTWFTSERTVLRTMVTLAAAKSFDSHALKLANALGDFLRRKGYWVEWNRLQQIALQSARRLSDPLALAQTHRNVARALMYLNRNDDAHAQLLEALDQYSIIGDRAGEAHTHIEIGMTLDRRNRQREALTHARHALALYRSDGDLGRQADALNGIGWLHARLGEHQQALHYCHRALEIQRQLGDSVGQSETLDSLGYSHHHLGNYQQATACYERALELARSDGDRFHQAEVLIHLGDTHQLTDDDDAARIVWMKAVAILDELDHPAADDVRSRLIQLKTTRQ
jgi:DNA-binding SARP family transcriptional activator/tetratricopeptide (TPR) repeat protein